MLSKLKERFGREPQGPQNRASDTLAKPPSRCPGCNGDAWWLPIGQTQWRCEACSPPPSRSLVANRISNDPTVLEEWLVSACKPWCDHCGSWLGIESQWSSGRTETRCWSCRGPMKQWLEKEGRA